MRGEVKVLASPIRTTELVELAGLVPELLRRVLGCSGGLEQLIGLIDLDARAVIIAAEVLELDGEVLVAVVEDEFIKVVLARIRVEEVAAIARIFGEPEVLDDEVLIVLALVLVWLVLGHVLSPTASALRQLPQARAGFFPIDHRCIGTGGPTG